MSKEITARSRHAFGRLGFGCAAALAVLAYAVPVAAVPVLGPNGHYYELISTPMSWDDARTAALGSSHLGGQGQLATVLTPETNLFLSGLLGGVNAWLGGNDFDTPDTWVWADGPDAGVAFWQGTQGGGPVNGAYTNFGSNDPNNSGGNQDALLMCAQGVSPCLNENLGEWIDRPRADLFAYLVEFIPVPEPSTGTLLGLGLVAISGLMRRRD